MSTQGWEAINRSTGMAMFGCGASTDPKQCLKTLPEAKTTPYGATWANGGTLRVLDELDFNTYYWTRSSPDGRFVANGSTGSGSVITDLQSGKTHRRGAVRPRLLPTTARGCFRARRSAGLLPDEPAHREPRFVNFSEPQCSSIGSVSLYQHLGQGLGGGDYFVSTASSRATTRAARSPRIPPPRSRRAPNQADADGVRRHGLRRQAPGLHVRAVRRRQRAVTVDEARDQPVR